VPPSHVLPRGQLSLVSHWRSPTQWPWSPWAPSVATQRCHNAQGLSSPTVHSTDTDIGSGSGSAFGSEFGLSSLQPKSKDTARTRQSKTPARGVFIHDLFFAASGTMCTYLHSGTNATALTQGKTTLKSQLGKPEFLHRNYTLFKATHKRRQRMISLFDYKEGNLWRSPETVGCV